MVIIRIKTPTQHLEGSVPLGMLFGSGDLDFKDKDKAERGYAL